MLIFILNDNKSTKRKFLRDLCLHFGFSSDPGGNTPQDTNCTATYPLSGKLFKLDEPDMQDTAGEAGTNS